MIVQLGEQTVFYADGGVPHAADKPYVVFIHGAGMNHTVWTLFTRWFARNGFNVIAVDLPGHGRTAGPLIETVEGMAEWLLRLLDSLGVSRAILAGHSMGSLVALHAAGTAPARVERVALLGFSYPMAVGKPLLEAARANSHDAIDMLMIWGHDGLAQIGGNAVPGMGIITPIQRIVERAAPGVLFNDLHACHVYQQGEAMALCIEAPLTLILGDRDRMTPLKSARAFMQNFRRPGLILIQDCGHGMMEERPEETWRALSEAFAA